MRSSAMSRVAAKGSWPFMGALGEDLLGREGGKGAVPVIGSLELLGDGGTGNREPHVIRTVAGAGGVVRRGPFLGSGADDAVAVRGVVLDAALAEEFAEDAADARVPCRGALADLALRERRFGVREHLDDALFGRFWLRHSLVGHRAPQAQGGPLAVIGEFELDVVEAGGGAMLDGHDDLLVAPAQVEVAVAPGMRPGIQLHPFDARRGAPFG